MTTPWLPDIFAPGSRVSAASCVVFNVSVRASRASAEEEDCPDVRDFGDRALPTGFLDIGAPDGFCRIGIAPLNFTRSATFRFKCAIASRFRSIGAGSDRRHKSRPRKTTGYLALRGTS